MLLIPLAALFRSPLFALPVILITMGMNPPSLSAAQCQSTTFASPLRSQEQRSFSADDTIYFYLYCDQLTKADNTVVIDWVTPTGTIRGQTVDSFSTTSDHDIFQKVFAVKLPRKGFISQIFTGVRYGDELYGNWTYRVHLNGVLLDRDSFIIH